MAVVPLKLSDYGLVTVAEAAEVVGRSVSAVQKWVQAGALPVVVLGGAVRTTYLLDADQVRAFAPRPRGRPVGATKKKKKPRGRPLNAR